MQFPVKAHYALLSMLAMAEVYESEQLLTAGSISKSHRIPSQFLGQILQQLRASGLISSVRGSNGGFRLMRPPSDINALEVIDAVCPRNTTYPASKSAQGLSSVVTAVWRELESQQREHLEQVSLQNLLSRAMHHGAAMFYI
jgi:Rrf2 family protein